MLKTWAYVVREAFTNAATRSASLADLRPPRRDEATTGQRLAAAVRWLCVAQDASPHGGVSYGYDLKRGWGPPYPETTGYIISTLIESSRALHAHQLMCTPDEVRQRASALVDWLLSIQMASGAIQGGTTAVTPLATVFNTGQVLDGWCRYYGDAPHESVLQAITRAVRWLVSMQDEDGCWRKGLSPLTHQTPATYNARSAMALHEAGVLLDDAHVRAASIRNLDWVLTQQLDTGWFANNGLYDNERPLTHAIGYTLEALEYMWRAVGDQRYLDAVVKASGPLLDAVSSNGYLSGQFDRAWRPSARWSCLTGSSQIAMVWYRLSTTIRDGHYKDAADRLINYVRRTQQLDWPDVDRDGGSGVGPTMGAIKGSHPIWGRYDPYGYPNWATKFFIDALLAGRAIEATQKPAPPKSSPIVVWPAAPPTAVDPQPARGLSLAYVVESYPTFIVNEILALRRLGATVIILSAFRPQPQADPERDALRREALYFPTRYKTVVRANSAAVFRHPLPTLTTGVRLARHGQWFRMMPLAVWMASEIRRQGVQHVHATFGTRTTLLAYAVGRIAGVPFSFTTHAYDIFRPNPTLGWKTRAASFMRTISVFNRRFMEHRYPEIDAGKVEVGYLGVDTGNAGCPARRRNGGSPFRILAVGDLIPEKGHAYLIDSCRHLRARGVVVACDILGQGPLQADLEQRIATADLTDDVRLFGRADHAQVRQLLDRADLFALACADQRASGYHVDGIPVAIMEAMALGIPVVSTRVSGIPELIEHGVSGMLVPEKNPTALADAIQRVIQDPVLRERIGAGGAARVRERFDLLANTAALAQRFSSSAGHARPAQTHAHE